MRLRGLSLIVTAFAAALCAGSAFAHELQRGGNVSCQGPFTNKETGLDVMARYKSAAKIEEITALDGESFNGVVLFRATNWRPAWRWRTPRVATRQVG